MVFNRSYLLLAPIIAFSLPLLEIPVAFEKPSIEVFPLFDVINYDYQQAETIAQNYKLPEFTVESKRLPMLWDAFDYILLVYGIITGLLLIRFAYQICQLKQLIRQGWYQTKYILKEDYYDVPTHGNTPIFSFWDYLFWNYDTKLSERERNQILHHELEHIKQKHSFDVIFFELICIFFWFNPLVYLLKTAAADTHEYLADESVVKHAASREDYTKLIVKMAFKGLDLPLGNYFAKSLTLKRVKMMKNQNHVPVSKLLMVIPVLLGMMFLVSFKSVQPEAVEVLDSFSAPSTVESISASVSDTTYVSAQPANGLEALNRYLSSNVNYPLEARRERIMGTVEVAFVVDANGKIVNPTIKRGIGGGCNEEAIRLISSMPAWNPAQENGKNIASEQSIRFTFDIPSDGKVVNIKVHTDHLKPLAYNSDEVFEYVDNSPNPAGGMEGWLDYLSKNVKYPEVARNEGIEGTVYLSFIVQKDGSLADPKVMKGVSKSIDAEAIRVIKEAPKWEPGTQRGRPVNVMMRLPIRFKLGGDANKGAVSDEFPEVIEIPITETQAKKKTSADGEFLEVIEIPLEKKKEKDIVININASDKLMINNQEVLMENLERTLVDLKKQYPNETLTATLKTVGQHEAGTISDVLQALRSADIRQVKFDNPKRVNTQQIGNISVSQVDGTKPLFLVDGKKVTESYLKSIDGNKIQSFEIIKASSAAEYVRKFGDQANNGVVLVTLK